ncbi:MAG: Tol-Pal system subunit TolQ [Acidobacteria bacterium]|nr:Tol-Pal system subunit TolQ [Acidobacteriota bacterium]
MRTLGSLWFALQVQAEPIPEGTSQTILSLVAQATIVSKGVLLILGLLSIYSWSVILYKLWTLGRARRQSAQFLEVFRRSQKFSEVQAVCKSLDDSPLVGLFQSGYAELTTQLRHTAADGQGNPQPASGRPTLRSLTAVDRSLMRAAVVEVNKLEKRIAFLATTASTAPFVGLLGTVWGIIVAFQRIGQTGSTNLAAVGPGIAEALIATAAGLFAAIPAAWFYNHLTSDVKLMASEMDDFSMEFLNIAERNFT